MPVAHGVNIGNGYVKYVVIDESGDEQPAVVFPAVIAPAHATTDGSVRQAAVVHVDGRAWWTGEDTRLSGAPLTLLSQDRLTDPVFLPALVCGALGRLGSCHGDDGYCVSGLPATWSQDRAKAQDLGARLRSSGAGYQVIRVIAEPLGLVYAELLDINGCVVEHTVSEHGRIGVVDLGHLTVDLAVVDRGQPVPTSLETFTLGSAHALRQIRAHISAVFDMDMTLHQVDAAIQQGWLLVAGTRHALPDGWDRPLLENAETVARRIVEAWGRGRDLETILLGGGGAQQERLVAAICDRFHQAVVVAQPQTAIARGYARLARRIAQAHHRVG